MEHEQVEMVKILDRTAKWRLLTARSPNVHLAPSVVVKMQYSRGVELHRDESESHVSYTLNGKTYAS